MTDGSPSRWKLGPLALAFIVCAAVLAWLAIPGLRPEDALARRWEQELDSLHGNELSLRLSQIAELGDAGIPALAGALFSEREEIADAALVTIEAELVRWQTLDVRESSPKAALLARGLASQVTRSNAPRNRAAADIATRIVVWPVDRSVVDNSQLIADCESVLVAAARPSPPGSLVASPPGLDDGDRKQYRGAREGAAGVLLPTEEDRIAPSPDDLVGASESDNVRIPVSRSKLVPDSGGDLDSASPELPPTEQPGAPARLVAKSAKPLVPRKPLRDLADLDLMHLLHSPDSVEEGAAEQELMRRGFTAIRLRVARRATDPDVKARRELAELLPQMSGLDARPWLLMLSRDPDASVRRAAATIIATSSDPQLLGRLREMRSLDADLENLRQAERPERNPY